MNIGCVIFDQLGVACERARFPHMDEEPLALSEQGSAVIRVTSAEAAQYGVAAGQTVAGARSLCPDLIVLRYDRAAYEVAAHAIYDVLAAVSDTVEPVSPEMAFVLFSPQHAEQDAALLSAKLARAVGIPIRIGIGRSKIVAERAARASAIDKGSGPVQVIIGQEAALLASLPIARIAEMPRRFIGRVKLDRRMILRLERLGIRTLGDVLALPLDRLPRQLRSVGQLLRDLAYGVDRDPVRPLWPPRTLMEEVCFDEGVEDRRITERSLRPLAERIAHALTDEAGFCRTLTLRAGLLDGTYLNERDRFVVPLSRVDDLHRHALRLLSALPVDQPLASLSLTAGELGAGSGYQLALPTLGDARHMPIEVRRQRLEATLDFLRREFGLRAVMMAGQMVQTRRAALYGAVPLGRLYSDPVRVATDGVGQPVRYWRRPQGQSTDNLYQVRRIADRWRESKWNRAVDLRVTDAEVWRVETDPDGLSELRQVGAEWRLTAMMD